MATSSEIAAMSPLLLMVMSLPAPEACTLNAEGRIAVAEPHIGGGYIAGVHDVDRAAKSEGPCINAEGFSLRHRADAGAVPNANAAVVAESQGINAEGIVIGSWYAVAGVHNFKATAIHDADGTIAGIGPRVDAAGATAIVGVQGTAIIEIDVIAAAARVEKDRKAGIVGVSRVVKAVIDIDADDVVVNGDGATDSNWSWGRKRCGGTCHLGTCRRRREQAAKQKSRGERRAGEQRAPVCRRNPLAIGWRFRASGARGMPTTQSMPPWPHILPAQMTIKDLSNRKRVCRYAIDQRSSSSYFARYL